jgi:hypothetical protein
MTQAPCWCTWGRDGRQPRLDKAPHPLASFCKLQTSFLFWYLGRKGLSLDNSRAPSSESGLRGHRKWRMAGLGVVGPTMAPLIRILAHTTSHSHSHNLQFRNSWDPIIRVLLTNSNFTPVFSLLGAGAGWDSREKDAGLWSVTSVTDSN